MSAVQTSTGTQKAESAPAIIPPPIKLHKAPQRWPVVLIGITKLFKAAGLSLVAYMARYLLAAEQRESLESWIEPNRVDPHNIYIHKFISWLLSIPENQLHVLRIGALVYAGLYLIEGFGLLKDKKWAEWMVIVTTAGFLPLEIYEIYDKLSWERCLLLAVNLVVLIYLAFRLHRQAQVKREQLLLGQTSR